MLNDKLYQFFCQYCSYKLISNGTNIGLVEHKTSKIQTKIPDLDPETGVRQEIKFKDLPRRFKCPQCGNLIKPRVVDNPQSKIDEENRLQERISRRMAYEKEQDRIEVEKRKENENRVDGDKTSTK